MLEGDSDVFSRPQCAYFAYSGFFTAIGEVFMLFLAQTGGKAEVAAFSAPFALLFTLVFSSRSPFTTP